MRRKIIIGNWKMNGNRLSNMALLKAIRGGVVNIEQGYCDLAVCVPSPYLWQCQQYLNGTIIHWGAQDLSLYASGAHTGEVSGSMLADFGCRYVLVGHSERRANHGEGNPQIAAKAAAAIDAGLRPVVCVGETLAERESGLTDHVVGLQIDHVIQHVMTGRNESELEQLIFAYEPIWAIGTGKTASPDMAQQAHSAIRGRIATHSGNAAQRIQLLYGGSMKADNAMALLAMPDIDGGLVGGASLCAQEFLNIFSRAPSAYTPAC